MSATLAPVRGMSRIEDRDIGRIYLPNPSLSLPGRPTMPKYSGVVRAVHKRPLWSLLRLDGMAVPDGGGRMVHLSDLHIEQPWPSAEAVLHNLLLPFRHKVDPALFETEILGYSVTHNERVNKGGDIQVNRVFGTVGTTGNGVINVIAVATTGYTTTTASNLSIGSASANVTTNEFTTIGLSRAVGTVQNYVAATALNGTYAVDVFKSFSATGGGTAHGAAIFDSTTVSGSFLYCEDIFSSDAVVVNGDTLAVTWTVNN